MNDNILSTKSNNGKLAVLLHALAIVSFVAASEFIPDSFGLKTMSNLIISQATGDGIDIAMRVNVMYKFLFGGSIAVFVLYKLLRYTEAKLSFSFLRHYDLMLLSASIICMAFLQAMDAGSLTTLKLLAMIFWVRLGVLLPVKRLDFATRILKREIIFYLCVIFAFYSLFASFLILGSRVLERQNIFWAFSAFLFLYSIAFVLFGKKDNKSYKKLTAFLLPLVSVPYIAFLSIETLFYVKKTQGYFISYKWLFIVLLGIAWLVMNLFLLRRKAKEISLRSIIRKWVAPSMVFGFVLLAFYAPVQQPLNEMYEYANPANSMMNVFAFREIPFLDFMSTHLMIEQWYGYIYNFIFGYQPNMDFIIYNIFNITFFYFVLYFLLNKLFKRPLLSLFFIFFFPFIHEVFYSYIFVAVAPFFLSRQLLEKPSPKVFFNFFLIMSVLIAWKIDTGAAAVFAAAFYFPILYFISKTRFPVKAFLKGSGLFLIIPVTLLIIAAILRSPAAIVHGVKMLLDLYGASQAHGLTEIMSGGYSQQFYIYHILFPFIGIVCCAYILITLSRQTKAGLFTDCYLLLGSLYLFLLFFANLQRGLVRHGFAERGENILVTTFFAALALLVVYLFKSKKHIVNLTLFYVAGYALFILLKFFPFHTSETTLDFALNNNGIASVGDMIAGPGYSGRTMVDSAFADETYLQLKDFLDKNITRDQTFLDFSNSPMLYFYCQRKVVGYFNQNLQNTVDDYLQFDMLNEMKTLSVPIVVFACYPRAWFDAADGTQNVLRYYLIAEYIFRHYKPYGVIGNKSVWVSNSFHPLPPAAKKDDLLEQAENTELKLIPEYTGLFYKKPSNAKELETVYVKTDRDFTLRNDSLVLKLDASVLALKSCYLSIEFKKAETHFDPIQMQAQFRDAAGINVGILSFTRRDLVSNNYMIRLSNHYFWHRYPSLELCIPSANGIKQITVLKDTRISN